MREANRSDRVGMLGLVSDGRLEDELRSAALGVVTQCPGLPEFNLPSKLMNYMAYGVPEVAAVEPGSEVARIIESSGAGWVGLTCSASVSGEEPLSRRGSIEPAGEPLVVLLDDHACGEPGPALGRWGRRRRRRCAHHLAVEALERIGRAGGQRAR